MICLADFTQGFHGTLFLEHFLPLNFIIASEIGCRVASHCIVWSVVLTWTFSINAYRKEELERYKEEQKKPVAPDSDVLKMLQNTHLDQKSPTNTGSFSRLQHQLDNEGKVNTSF